MTEAVVDDDKVCFGGKIRFDSPAEGILLHFDDCAGSDGADLGTFRHLEIPRITVNVIGMTERSLVPLNNEIFFSGGEGKFDDHGGAVIEGRFHGVEMCRQE
jgi:hypothetical protein